MRVSFPTTKLRGIKQHLGATMLARCRAAMREGFAVHLYTCNESMQRTALANADGHFLIVPQQGRCAYMHLGRSHARPGQARRGTYRYDMPCFAMPWPSSMHATATAAAASCTAPLPFGPPSFLPTFLPSFRPSLNHSMSVSLQYQSLAALPLPEQRVGSSSARNAPPCDVRTGQAW